jgi:hypothetical protein
VSSEPQILPDGCVAIRFKMQIYRGKMPLPLVIFDVDRKLYAFITLVGVASSPELCAPLLNRIDALPSNTILGFEPTSSFCTANKLQISVQGLKGFCECH